VIDIDNIYKPAPTGRQNLLAGNSRGMILYYINSGCIGMIKPQSTLQNAEFENREMDNSDAKGFDIMSPEITIIKFAVRTSVLSLGLGIDRD